VLALCVLRLAGGSQCQRQFAVAPHVVAAVHMHPCLQPVGVGAAGMVAQRAQLPKGGAGARFGRVQGTAQP
jgi:hypothetical protein